jgi:hypothetical protein
LLRHFPMVQGFEPCSALMVWSRETIAEIGSMRFRLPRLLRIR